MSRCPLCKTIYPDGTAVCKIDGTRLGPEPRPRAASTAAVPSLAAREQQNAGQGMQEGMQAAAAGKRRPLGKGASLASMTDDELTAAAVPVAMAARARGDAPPPRIATGSGTAAPQSEERDAWSSPFVEASSKPLDSKDPESWIGQSLGAYKLLSILGKGGMGCVYRAEHEKLGREVALKVLRSDYSERKDAVARFFQEARAVNKIRHRNIVDITDFVEIKSGVVFIIMEYLKGAPLTKHMRSKTGVEPVRALGLLIQICDGLAAAHSVGIVHRDLKPDNIMVAKDHRGADLIKLLDFGVAKLLDKTEDDDIGLQTVAGSVVGTPAFMSPEQAGGSDVDGRADLYSLGAIMYEMFTKQPLFRGKSFGEFVRKHLNETPTRPTLTKAGRDMHPRAEEVILRCLEKNPDDRFQTAQELRTELLSLLATLETSGEMTAHLKQVQPAPAPIGAARPRGTDPNQPSDAQMPPFYEMQGQHPPREPTPAVNQVLVSSSPSHGSPPSSPGHASLPSHASGRSASHASLPTPSHIGTEPPLTNPSHLMQPPVAALSQPPVSVSGQMHLGYPTNQSQRVPYVPTAQSAIREPSSRNMRGVGIAAGICVVALIALLARSGSSDEEGAVVDGDAGAAAAANLIDDPTPKDTPKNPTLVPEVQPLTDDPVDTPPRIIVVAMTSDPVADVFAVGAVSPLCKTPCDVEIDSADGGSPSRRDFILRTESHTDATITINLRAPRESVFTTLSPTKTPPPIKVPTRSIDDTKTKTDRTRTDRTKTDRTKTKTDRTKTDRTKTKTDRTKTGDKLKPKCKAGAQDTFNPFGEAPCRK